LEPAVAVEPIVSVGLAGEAFNDAVFLAGILGENLPVILGDATKFERNFLFCHPPL
jgi:hypothetical protein